MYNAPFVCKEIPVTLNILWAFWSMNGKHFARNRKKPSKSNHHLWLVCKSTCFPVFLSFLITKQAASCISFVCYRNMLSGSFECWSKRWPRKYWSASLGFGFRDMWDIPTPEARHQTRHEFLLLPEDLVHLLGWRCQTHFHWGPQQLHGCLRRVECRAPCP